MMKFGIVYPNSTPYCDTALILQSALLAEELGFDSMLLWDHYTMPDSNESFEVWALLSYLAARTATIRLGTCVTPIPFRPPAVLAKMASTVDLLSNGRLIIGIGAGWHRPEFDGYSRWDSASVRVAKTKEGLELMLKLWTEKEVDFRGRYYVAKGAILEPKPLQKPHPPLWFGTTGEFMLRLAAEHGDGWIPTGISPRTYKALADRLGALMKAKGRKPMTFAYQGEAIPDVREAINTIEKYREAGCSYYAIVWDYDPKDFLKQMKRFAKEVIPEF